MPNPNSFNQPFTTSGEHTGNRLILTEKELGYRSNKAVLEERARAEAEARAKAEAEERARYEAEARAKAEAEERAKAEAELKKNEEELKRLGYNESGTSDSSAFKIPEIGGPAVNSITTDGAESDPNTSAEATGNKAKKNPALKKVIGAGAVIAAIAIIAAAVKTNGFGLFSKDKAADTSPNEPTTDAPANPGVNNDETPKAPEPEKNDDNKEANPLIGELENGTTYDYTHYADRYMLVEDDTNKEAWEALDQDFSLVLTRTNKDGNLVKYATNKEAWNAYDYDYSDVFGDREKTVAGFMEVASRTPEAVASYAYSVFTDEEKAELGITGMSITEIDDYLSNDPSGGEMQEKLLSKLNQVANSDMTIWKFYNEDNVENTNYLYWVDDNGDGNMDPTEVHVGYDTRKRDGAPQADMYRLVPDGHDKDGDQYISVKVLDVNLRCGFQPNYTKEETPPGVKKIPADPTEDDNTPPPIEDKTTPESTVTPPPAEDKTTPEPTVTPTPGGNTPTPWGKSGDTHGDGKENKVSDKVDTDSKVTQEKSENEHKGNKGQVDDNKATPGSSSELNGVDEKTGFAESGIAAPGATTDEGRLKGGENQAKDEQGNAQMAGENAYQNQAEMEAGQAVDQAGNAAQAEAQQSGGPSGEGLTPGGDNYSDAAEEAAIAGGNF